ncbi:MAG: hypothetical protein AAF996_05845 [Pseudomonadota bacterium]
MFALQLIAFFFLAVSVLFCFGPRLAVYGPRALGEMGRQRQVQFVGGCLSSILVMIVVAPGFSAGPSAYDGAVPVALQDAAILSASFA